LAARGDDPGASLAVAPDYEEKVKPSLFFCTAAGFSRAAYSSWETHATFTGLACTRPARLG